MKYHTESRTRNYVMRYECLSLARNTSDKYGKKLIGTAAKKFYMLQKLLLKIVHKAAEATGELMRNKIARKIVKPKAISDAKLSNVEKTNLSSENRK